MVRFLQVSALAAIALVLANHSEAGHTDSTVHKTPVHGPGSSHDPKGPKLPVHGPGSSHDPRGPNRTYPHEYHSWGHRYWNSSYRCEYCWSPVDSCYFYYYAPACCYYPVTCIEAFPPVQGAALAPMIAPKTAAPAFQIPR
jgi:hypothetical protein